MRLQQFLIHLSFFSAKNQKKKHNSIISIFCGGCCFILLRLLKKTSPPSTPPLTRKSLNYIMRFAYYNIEHLFFRSTTTNHPYQHRRCRLFSVIFPYNSAYYFDFFFFLIVLLPVIFLPFIWTQSVHSFIT
jgi:hypothetical protein